jgi:hypothetical protein
MTRQGRPACARYLGLRAKSSVFTSASQHHPASQPVARACRLEAGALTGDRSTEAKGKIERAQGSVQEKYGEIKSALKDENGPKRA